MCPEGVERVKLGTICSPLTKGALDMRNLPENGMYPVFNSGKEVSGFYDNYNNDCEAITIASRGEYAGCISYVEGKFWAGVLCYPYKLKYDTKSLLRYVFYSLKSFEIDIMNRLVSRGGIPAINKKDIENFEIPLPPLPIQQEIVNILDNFTSLQQNLEDELKLREKQYEYYREKLLTFEDGECEWKKLGEVCEYSNLRIHSDDLNVQNYISVENLLQNKEGRKDATNVPQDGYWTKYMPGDTLIGNIRPYLKKIWYSDREGGTNGDVLVIRKKQTTKLILDSKFLYKVLSSEDFFDYDNNNARGAKMPRGNKDAVMMYCIPIPSKDKQQQIVSTLDHFESLISNLKTEIELRKKQYEYYREKLLTFKKII